LTRHYEAENSFERNQVYNPDSAEVGKRGIDFINAYRTTRGLTLFKWSDELYQIAS